ncbi:MAG: methyltransferase family protein [Planctomycetota bacterium]
MSAPLVEPDAAAPAGSAAERESGWLFDNRRLVHLPFVLAAALLGGARPLGLAAGLVLLVLHLLLRLWCCRHLRGSVRVHSRKAQERKVLVTSGPFAWVRNPLYLANALGLAGACLALGPAWLASLAALTCLAWYAAVVAWEERVLQRLYGDEFRAYCAAVPRFLPRPPRPSGSAERPPYPWKKVFKTERSAVLLVAVIALLAWARQTLGS